MISIKFRATTDSSYASSFYVDNVSVSTTLQGISDPNDMEGELQIKPEPKPVAPSGMTEER